MGALAAVLAAVLPKLIVAILQWGAAREDFRRKIVQEVELAGAYNALEALGWKVLAATRPDGGATLRVRDAGEAITLQGGDPPDHPPPGTSVHHPE